MLLKKQPSPPEFPLDWKEVSLAGDFQLVRQSQIVQSVMQDYQYDLSHLLPV